MKRSHGGRKCYNLITNNDKIALIGNGSIGSKVKSNNITVMKRKHSLNFEEYDTLIVSVQPEENKHLINNDILSKFKGKLISVSRSTVIDNEALLKNIDNISHAYVDTLDENLREDLLATGKVTYTKHTAWEHNFSFEGNPYYYGDLHDILLHCLFDNVKDLDIKPVLDRIERVTF